MEKSNLGRSVPVKVEPNKYWYTNIFVPRALLELSLEEDSVLVTLVCTRCTHGARKSSFIGIPVFSKRSIDQYKTTNTWFSTALVGSYIDLVAHEQHRTGVKIALCLNPNEKSKPDDLRTLPNDVTRLLSYVYAGSHYALLDINLSEKIITVTDGLQYPPSTWKDHIIHILVKYNKVRQGLAPSAIVNTSKYQHMPPQPNFIPTIQGPFILIHSSTVTQLDGHNCGPIVCHEVRRILSSGDAPTETMSEMQDANNLNNLKRQRVLSHYSELVDTLVSEDLLRVRRHNMCHDVTDKERQRFPSLDEEDDEQIESKN